MTEREIAAMLLLVMMFAAFVVVLRQRDRAERKCREARQARDHWKENYDLAVARLAAQERYIRRVDIVVRNDASPALEAVRQRLREMHEAIGDGRGDGA